MRKLYFILWVLFYSLHANAFDSKLLTFEFEGETLSAVLSTPTNSLPEGLVLIIHGYGETNAVKGNWHADIRLAMSEAGYATYM